MSDEDDSKLQFTFDFIRDNFSKVKVDARLYSRKYSVADVAWTLEISRGVAKKSEKHHLKFFLHALGETKLWCCYARIQLTILSQKENVTNYSRNFETLFSSSNSSRGYDQFIDWDRLMNPEMGYIKNDTVKFQVFIVADPPQNVDPDYKKDIDEPEDSDDWLSLFEEKINVQIVSRISEEFKKVTSLMEAAKHTEVQSKADLIRNIKLVTSAVVGAVDQVRNFLIEKYESNNSAAVTAIGELEKVLMEKVENDSSVFVNAVDELKNLLLKKDENNSVADCEEEIERNETDKNKNRNAEKKAVRKTGLENKDTVNKMLDDFKNELKKDLNDFKNDMRKEFVAEHFKYPRAENATSYGGAPWSDYNGHFTQPYWGHQVESDRLSCNKFNFPYHHESAFVRDPFGCSIKKKSARNEPVCHSPTSSVTSHQLRQIEHYLKNGCEENEGDSSDLSRLVLTQKISKLRIPSEEEAFDENLDLTKPWKKELLLIGKNDFGKLEIHKATCLKEFYELKKKYEEFEILEAK